jgi:uncharacterized membrane protein YGL010W
MGKRTMSDWLSEYGESHQNATNKAIHWVCVPVIFWCIIGLLSLIPVPEFLSEVIPAFNFAWLLVLFGLFFFARLSFSITIGMGLISGAFLLLAHQLNHAMPDYALSVYVILFAVAWIGQFYGHKVEGKKPSFLKDLQFLLIGPAWLLSFVFKRLNISI